MAQPLYRRLHQRYPGLILDVLAPAWTRPLHARMPEVNESFDTPFGHGELKLGARWSLARQMKKRGYDQVIVLPNSLKSALVPLFSGIKTRTGWVGESRYGLLNDTRVLDPLALPKMVERFAALAEDSNQPVQRPVPFPHLVVSEQERNASSAKLGFDSQKPMIALCPGAEYGPAKRWPGRHMATLAQTLIGRGFQVCIFGSNKDREIADEILAGAPEVIDYCGKTSLAEAIDMMSFAQVVISNDSGLMHVAAALERPLVAIYGSSSPEFTPPLSSNATIATLDLECSPCFERVCPLKHMNCLNQLEPNRVITAVDSLLA
ncbi:MAG: lipopolysaccharide heptosyltransferase [Pseudomonadota bacterium]